MRPSGCSIPLCSLPIRPKYAAQPHHLQISPGIPQLVAALKASGKQVFLVSGGFRLVIHPIAEVRPCHFC